MSKSIYKTKATQNSTIGHLVAKLQEVALAQGGSTFVSKNTAKSFISMESIDSVSTQNVESSIETLERAVKQSAMEIGLESLTVAQIEAMRVAAVVSADPLAYFSQKHQTPASTEDHRVVPAMESVDRLSVATEAYDERDNRNAAIYSVAYNMMAAKQDEFGETLFPTVVVTPDNFGYRVAVELVTVVDDFRRQVSGAVDSFNRRNIIHAVRDSSILRNDSTDIVPVYRAASAANFVDTSVLATRTVSVGGENVTTSALAFGKKFSLLGISQTDTLVAAGLMDQTDSVDPALSLEALILRAPGGAGTTDDDVIRLSTSGLFTSVFNPSQQGAVRTMQLFFENSSLLIKPDTKRYDGTALQALAVVASGNWNVALSVSVTGSVNLQDSTTSLNAGAVEVVSVTDANGTKYAPTDGAVAAVVAAFAGATLIGYELKGRRSNLNRRQRGKLLDTITYQQSYFVPLLAPISIPRPLGNGDSTDPSDLRALVTATRVQTSNAAVTELLRAADVLEKTVLEKSNAFDRVEVLGVGRYLVTPAFIKKPLDFGVNGVGAIIDSTKSHERAADIQAVLVNAARDIAYNLYRDSGYKAAADAINGGEAAKPTVILATDPVTAGYLQVVGDIRTLGEGFNCKIVTTLDERVKGKIFVTFGDFGTATSGTPNPLHFGNMAFKPEMTIVLPISRNGQTSKELTAQASFLHVTNLPVLGVVEVSNLSEVVANKIAVWTDEK